MPFRDDYRNAADLVIWGADLSRSDLDDVVLAVPLLTLRAAHAAVVGAVGADLVHVTAACSDALDACAGQLEELIERLQTISSGRSA